MVTAHSQTFFLESTDQFFRVLFFVYSKVALSFVETRVGWVNIVSPQQCFHDELEVQRNLFVCRESEHDSESVICIRLEALVGIFRFVLLLSYLLFRFIGFNFFVLEFRQKIFRLPAE
jgi:hypothetical protein